MIIVIFIYFLIVIVYLIIDYLIAREFYNIAGKKGHYEKKYLWITFMFGIIGYCMVIALPDRGSEKEKNFIAEPTPVVSKSVSASIDNSNDVICCNYCGTDNPKGAKICKKCHKPIK